MHHDTPEVQAQIAAKITAMFKQIVTDEVIELDVAIGDTAAFKSIEGDLTTYAITYEGQEFTIDLDEEAVDGLLNDEENHVDFLDGCVYGIVCDIEDAKEAGADLNPDKGGEV